MIIALALISLCLAVVSYGLYLRNIIRGRTKPHAVTWLVWSLLNTFVFVQQVIGGAGPGAWVTGAAGVANLIIFIVALRRGQKTVTWFDWLCLLLVGIMISVWLVSADATIAVAMAVGIFLVGLLPTFRKSLRNAQEETAATYLLNGVKFLLALLALETISLVTALYPLTLFLINSIFGIYLVSARKRQAKGRQGRRAP